MDILRGLPGLLVILLIGYLFSIRRSAVSWRLVISGLTLQIIIALLVFQVPFFTSFFNSVGTGLVKFLSFGLDGAAFIFGDLVRNSDTQENVRHNLGFVFAFQALPIVVFFS